MKKIISILSILSLIFLSACEVEDGSYYSNRTLQGKAAFDQMQSYTDDIVHLTEMVSRASLYKDAAQDEKEAVKTYYFSNYTLVEDITNKTITIKDKTSTWIFHHNGKSINQIDAKWNITLSVNGQDSDITIVQPSNYTLESKGDKTWKLTIEKLPASIRGVLYNKYPLNNHVWSTLQQNAQNATLEVTAKQAVAQSANLYNYTLESGTGYSSAQISIFYTIQSPLIYTSDIQTSIRMKEGALDIEVTTGMIKDEIKAKMENEVITITMQGITETYDQGNYYFW